MAKAKSGKYWVTWAKTNAKNSTSLADLETSFQNKVTKFKQALEAAGATVGIDATRRSKKRAYLFHWCWKLSQGKCKAKDIPAMIGVDIDWDHGIEDASISAAKEMATGFGLAMPPRSTNPPALTSNHITGEAVDMAIIWSGKITVAKKDGAKVEVTFMPNVNANLVLHEVGRSYGVIKLKTDAPHWSYNGR